MIQQLSPQDLEHVYADAVNTIQSQMNFCRCGSKNWKKSLWAW